MFSHHPSTVSYQASLAYQTSLNTYIFDLTKLVGEGKPVDIFYLDIAKAFDKVSHQRLIAKATLGGIYTKY